MDWNCHAERRKKEKEGYAPSDSGINHDGIGLSVCGILGFFPLQGAGPCLDRRQNVVFISEQIKAIHLEA